jgi:nitroreductase
MTVQEAIRARRSVKRFRDQPVSRATIELLLELAALAPNHRMTEPWGFLVLGPGTRRAVGRIRGDAKASAVDDPDVADALAEKVADALAELPAVVAFTQRLDERPQVREEDLAAVYMGIQNFLLGAVAAGLAAHVKTGADLDLAATRAALGVGIGDRVVALVYLGEAEEMPDPKVRTPAVARTRWLP